MCHDQTSYLYNHFASVYPLYVAKAEKKGRTKTEVDELIRWLTCYTQDELETQMAMGADLETFLCAGSSAESCAILDQRCPLRCPSGGCREQTMQEIRYLDKLIDELAKGRAMEKILRQ